jgi:hypothetical protein
MTSNPIVIQNFVHPSDTGLRHMILAANSIACYSRYSLMLPKKKTQKMENTKIPHQKSKEIQENSSYALTPKIP